MTRRPPNEVPVLDDSGRLQRVRERREMHKWIVKLLRSDLYDRVPQEDTDRCQVWRGPLRWTVHYLLNEGGETWEVVVLRPDGTEYARQEMATDTDIHTWMLP